MSKLSPTEQIAAMAAAAPRSLTFDGQDFIFWKTAFSEKFREVLGPTPPSGPLDLEIQEGNPVESSLSVKQVDCYILNFACDDFSRGLAYAFSPKRKNWNGRTILLCHGHDPRSRRVLKAFSKGVYSTPYIDHVAEPVDVLVDAGFSVIAPVWRGFKERDGHYCSHGMFRDPCNVFGLGFGYAGYNLINLSRNDASRSIDALDKFSDSRFATDRIGVLGKSLGGTVAAVVAATDRRVRATVVSGYLSTIDGALQSSRSFNTCGSQYFPGLLQWADIPDIFGLIAPRPLLIEAGSEDPIFDFDDATIAFNHVAKIYRAAGIAAVLQRDVANVGHDYIFRNAIPFLIEHV